MERIRTQPCEACPYRQDAPSGLWSETDYDKLPKYDAPTFMQPFEPFACHATPEFLCHGWAVVHQNRGHEFELLSLRFIELEQVVTVPAERVPLFASGTEAAEYGKRDIEKPSRQTKRMARRLLNRYARLREDGES